MGQNNVDWLTVSPLSGSGNGVITITASTYSELETRIANITAYNTNYSTTSNTVNISQISGYENEYLTFHALSAGTFIINDNTFLYSKNNGSWGFPSNSKYDLEVGDKVRVKGSESAYNDTIISTASTCIFEVYGNVCSLRYGDNFRSQSFNIQLRSFLEGTKVVSAENLILQNETSTGWYLDFFKNCNLLTTAPDLPCKDLSYTGTCFSMFENCVSLTEMPYLPATGLTERCYENMFAGCVSIESSKELPATNLPFRCYCGMFSGCTNLIDGPSIINGIIKGYESAHAVSHTEDDMQGSCRYMFKDCTSLTGAPVISYNVESYGVVCMYSGCSSLSKIEFTPSVIGSVGFPTWSYQSWTEGVAVNGVFVRNPNMEFPNGTLAELPTGANGIPSGWTIQDA